uniref:LigA n=1 Tax=Parastrongyloides trichosuri TaxID=131310 RepID=A0A0N4ZIQ4_PARTI
MPDAATGRAQPLRSGDGRPAGQSGAAGAARPDRPAQGLRRRRRGPGRDDRRAEGPDAASRRRVRRRTGADRGARRPCAAGSGGRLAGRAERRHPAPAADGQTLSFGDRGGRPVGHGEDLRRRLRRPGQLAGQVAGPARQDHPQGLVRDRAPAGRLPGLRRRVPAPADAEDGGGSHRDARIHRQPRHLEQIRLHPARGVRAEILLHRRHPVQRRRRRAFGRSGASPDKDHDRRRGRGRRSAERRSDRRNPQ